MDLNSIVQAVHQNAVSKGWHETERKPAEIHMLIVSEVAEATEEIRNETPPIYIGKAQDGAFITPSHPYWDEAKKPEGEAVELADVVIRVMDYFGSKGWNLGETIRIKHNYNKTRPFRHGGKAL